VVCNFSTIISDSCVTVDVHKLLKVRKLKFVMVAVCEMRWKRQYHSIFFGKIKNLN
jgi:hypothetical protein